MSETTLVMRTLTCRSCGMDWQRPRVRGNPPTRCPSCSSIPRPRRPKAAAPKPAGGGVNRIGTNTAGYRVALAVTTYRLAIEEATCALRLGRNAEALAALERVQAPTRTAGANKNNAVIHLPD